MIKERVSMFLFHIKLAKFDFSLYKCLFIIVPIFNKYSMFVIPDGLEE